MQTTTSRPASGNEQDEPLFGFVLNDKLDHDAGALFGVEADMPTDEQPVETRPAVDQSGNHPLSDDEITARFDHLERTPVTQLTPGMIVVYPGRRYQHIQTVRVERIPPHVEIHGVRSNRVRSVHVVEFVHGGSTGDKFPAELTRVILKPVQPADEQPVETPAATSEHFAKYVQASESRAIGNWLDAITSDMRSNPAEHDTERNRQDVAFVMNVLHTRALAEFGEACKSDPSYTLTRTGPGMPNMLPDDTLGELIDPRRNIRWSLRLNGWARAVILDELHSRAITLPTNKQPVELTPLAELGWPEDITLEDAYLRGFGRLRAIVEKYLDGITSRDELATRYDQILAAVAVYEARDAR